MIKQLWHRYVLRHYVVFVPALVPDEVMRDKGGKPLINVFHQDTFQRADAHYECSCGKDWT